MITAAHLSLLLAADLEGASRALDDFLCSGDMIAVDDGDLFGLRRTHDNVVTYFELGSNAPPMMLPTTAA